MGNLLSSAASTAPKAIGSAQDYINAINPSAGGPASDSGLPSIPGLSSLTGLFNGGGDSAGGALKLASTGTSFLPPPFDLAAIPLAIGSIIPGLISGGRSSTGPGSATADIASAGSAYSDPIVKLLSAGAGALPPGVPISSSSGAASGFGPYFDAARRAEDFVRWGAGGTNPKTSALDATTLKNALTEMGNPSDGTSTLLGIQNAWNNFIQKNPPGTPGYNQFLELQNGLTGTEKTLFEQYFRGGGGGTPGGPPIPPGPPNGPPNGPQGNPGLSFNPLSANSNPLSALGAIAPLLIAGQNVNPINPIRLPDQAAASIGPGNNQQKAAKKQKSNLMAQLLALLSQNGQSQQDSSTFI